MRLSDYSAILEKGYSAIDQFDDFPLASSLKKLDHLAWTVTARPISLDGEEPNMPHENLEQHLKSTGRMLPDEKLGEVYRQHIIRVMHCVNLLLSRDLGAILPEFSPKDWAQSPFVEYNKFLGDVDDELKYFIRFVTLYHDVGKVFHRDRHPMLGQHLLESASDEATRHFKDILGDSFSMMHQLIAHHDLFGVLCTGEASRPVLIDALRLGEAKRTIDCLVTLNLADIYGALSRMTPSIMTTVLNDWRFVGGLILDQTPIEGIIYKSKLEKQILYQAQEQERATERIRRLVFTVVHMLRKVPQNDRDALGRIITNDFVLDALKKRLGPELRVFCHDFALVCKFDYTLRFFVDLVARWVDNEKEKLRAIELQNPNEVVSVDKIDMSGIVAIIVELLVRLVTNYRDLTIQREAGRRRIGIELLGLTRSEEISERVISLLLSNRYTEGVNWVADEATAWYFI